MGPRVENTGVMDGKGQDSRVKRLRGELFYESTFCTGFSLKGCI